MKYKIYQSKGKTRDWRWTEIARNGEKTAAGEGYDSRSNAIRSVTQRIAELRRTVEIVDTAGKIIRTV